jgi:pyrroloquinoline-quinone synthase
METTNTDFLDALDMKIQAKHLLKHDFYQAWSRGELSMECLRDYAKEYYQHVKAFPTYLSAVHSHTDDPDMRRILLQNLIEEEAGSPNHPELWKQFALALGVTEDELKNHQTSAEMNNLISVFRQTCRQCSSEEGLAALYAYESQIPDICVSKIDGLKKHYGMQSPKGWEYFSVHIAADKEHAAQERELLSRCIQANNRTSVENAAGEILDVLWNFLSGLCRKYHITSACMV